MDMDRFIRQWLTDDRLRLDFNGRYIGTIADVTVERVNNRFAGAKVDEPTIRFADNVLLIPNQKMRVALRELFGRDSKNWIGQRVCIWRQAVSFTDRVTGEKRLRYEKRASAVEAVPETHPPFEAGGVLMHDEEEER
jgi:hypothetical protein